MRILHLSWEYPPVVHGGLGRHVHALAEAQAALGHEVVVVTQCPPADQPPVAYDEVVNGVRIVRSVVDPPHLPFDHEHLLAWVLTLNHAMTRAALRLLPGFQPDVVHAHDWLVAHAAATLKQGLSVPLVATMHATEAGRHQGWLPTELSRSIHTVEWWLTFEARRVIACSAHMRWEVTRLFELPPDKVDVIHNGIDIDRWSVPARAAASARSAYGPDGPLLVFSGRLEWEKGVHVLLDAMPALKRRFPGIRLVVAGRGGKEADLRAQARRLRLGRTVAFAGWLPERELHALVAAADVAVVPSIYEPFGLVALEAAALGTALVVADTGGLPEFVRSGLTGRVVPPGDAPALRDAIAATLADEVSARRMSRSARATLARDYGWDRIARQTVDAYENADREELLVQAAASPAALQMTIREGNLLRDAT